MNIQAIKVLRESTTFEREALWELALGNNIDITDSISHAEELQKVEEKYNADYKKEQALKEHYAKVKAVEQAEKTTKEILKKQ